MKFKPIKAILYIIYSISIFISIVFSLFSIMMYGDGKCEQYLGYNIPLFSIFILFITIIIIKKIHNKIKYPNNMLKYLVKSNYVFIFILCLSYFFKMNNSCSNYLMGLIIVVISLLILYLFIIRNNNKKTIKIFNGFLAINLVILFLIISDKIFKKGDSFINSILSIIQMTIR